MMDALGLEDEEVMVRRGENGNNLSPVTPVSTLESRIVLYQC